MAVMVDSMPAGGVSSSEDPSVVTTSSVGPVQSFLTHCCCLRIADRDTVPEWMLHQEETAEPSLFMRLCMCQCAPVKRQRSGIEQVPELRGLAGITLQYGEHETQGSLESLKWGTYDAERRSMEMAVFGGFYDKYTTGLWTEPTAPLWRSAMWCFLMNLARTANYTYEFQFSEDYRRADFRIKGNLAVFCCACCPCIPAWFTFPQCICNQYMEQKEDSEDGTHWVRYRGICGKTPEKYYDLHGIYTVDGEPTRFIDYLEEAPKQMMITY